MKNPMLNAIQKVKMAMKKKPKMAIQLCFIDYFYCGCFAL